MHEMAMVELMYQAGFRHRRESGDSAIARRSVGMSQPPGGTTTSDAWLDADFGPFRHVVAVDTCGLLDAAICGDSLQARRGTSNVSARSSCRPVPSHRIVVQRGRHFEYRRRGTVIAELAALIVKPKRHRGAWGPKHFYQINNAGKVLGG